jgi:hypothetical protein
LEHRILIQDKLDSLDTTARALAMEDFLGPKERSERRKAHHLSAREPNLKYFGEMAKQHHESKRRKAKAAHHMRKAHTFYHKLEE